MAGRWGPRVKHIQLHLMMRSWHGSLLCVTGLLWEKYTDHRWIPLLKMTNSTGFDGVFDLLNKQSGCRWFETPCCSCDVTLMCFPGNFFLSTSWQVHETCYMLHSSYRKISWQLQMTSPEITKATEYWTKTCLPLWSARSSLMAQQQCDLGICRYIKNYVRHDDVIKCKHFPRYCPFVRGIHRSPVDSPHKDRRSRVDSPHKGQWRGTPELWCFPWSAPEQTV